ncbi:hypothetical protein HA402_014258 [Bradysia odoriphaga]|nr:hypothetical protein HA402_014258 [Bradysia odoriphaga]
MKLNFLLLLFSVLICCLISCPNVAASDESSDESSSDDVDEFQECAGHYLKNKGKWDGEITAIKDEQMCNLGIGVAISELRNTWGMKVRRHNPYGETCTINQFERDVFDWVIKLRYIKGNEKISRNEQTTALDNTKKIIYETMKKAADLCGDDEDKLRALIANELNSSDE